MRQKAGITYYPPSLKNDRKKEKRGMNLASSFLLFSFFFLLLLLLLAFPFPFSFSFSSCFPSPPSPPSWPMAHFQERLVVLSIKNRKDLYPPPARRLIPTNPSPLLLSSLFLLCRVANFEAELDRDKINLKELRRLCFQGNNLFSFPITL